MFKMKSDEENEGSSLSAAEEVSRNPSEKPSQAIGILVIWLTLTMRPLIRRTRERREKIIKPNFLHECSYLITSFSTILMTVTSRRWVHGVKRQRERWRRRKTRHQTLLVRGRTFLLTDVVQTVLSTVYTDYGLPTKRPALVCFLFHFSPFFSMPFSFSFILVFICIFLAFIWIPFSLSCSPSSCFCLRLTFICLFSSYISVCENSDNGLCRRVARKYMNRNFWSKEQYSNAGM